MPLVPENILCYEVIFSSYPKFSIPFFEGKYESKYHLQICCVLQCVVSLCLLHNKS